MTETTISSTPTDQDDLGYLLGRVAVDVKQRRFDAAREKLDSLPPGLLGDPDVVQARLNMLMRARARGQAAALAASYHDWDGMTPGLLELAMAALTDVGEVVVALDLAEAAGSARNERVDRLAQAIARAEVDAVLDRFDREGPDALSGLTGPMLRSERHRRMVLRRILLRSRDTGDLQGLAASLGHVLAALPEAVEERIQYAAALRRLGRKQEARDACEGFPASSLDRPEVQQARLQAFLMARDFDAAGALAASLIRRNTLEPNLLRLGLTALLKAGRADEALLLVEAHRSGEEPEEIAELHVRAAYEAGERDKAMALLEEARESGSDSPALRDLAARIELDDFDRDAAEAQLRDALALAPDDLNAMLRLAELLIVRGAASEAIPLLETARERAPDQRLIPVLLARANKMLGNFDDTADNYDAAVELMPDDVTLLRQAASASSQAGREERAEELFIRSLNARENRMPGSFREGVESLDGQLADVDLPQARFDWAWQFFNRKGEVSRDEWERRAKWGFLADRLLFDWLEVRTESADQVMEYFTGLDELEQGLTSMREETGGLIMASAHVGPLFAGPLSLELLDFKGKWLASTPSLGTSLYRDMLISTGDQTETQVVRQVNRSIAEGYSIGLAVDGAPNMAAPRIPFQGQEITYSAFASRIAHKKRIASCYAAPRWENGLLRMHLFRLPDAQEGEPVEDFAERWKDAYLGVLAGELSGEPENLRMAGGIWRHIR